ncbi:MAG TPA: alpha/beta fold hydrolase, partial [Geminicoccaceae bacterium]
GAEVWRAGGSRLLDLGGDGAPVLVVPSLVNRSRILDITPEHSLLGHLAAAGLRPFLLDWGEPGPAERAFRIADYALGRGGAALRRVRRLTGRRPALLGYCMGGLLALALAATRRREVAGLALLATPWDFHAGPAPPGLAALLVTATLSVGTLGAAPVELLQSFFALTDPAAVADKFAAFASMAADQPRRGRTFVAVEDWLADGVPLAGPVALEALWSWYAANLPGRGLWQVGGRRVLPGRLRLPTFLAIPRRDRIVPPASAEALAALLPGAEVVRPSGGHVAMIVGARARDELHEPLSCWLRRNAASAGALSSGAKPSLI